jgi:hypothetical protein
MSCYNRTQISVIKVALLYVTTVAKYFRVDFLNLNFPFAMNSVFVGCELSADWRETFPTPSLNMASKIAVLTAIYWTESYEFLPT